MKTFSSFILLAFLPCSLLAAPGLTIYNQNFAVVRDSISLDLKKGTNDVTFDGATLQLEPDSVILRDSEGKTLQILEQNYRNDPVTESRLLSLYEEKMVDFIVHEQNKPDHVIQGKVIRSGYLPQGNSEQPIIEVDGKLQFSLPGQPLFPALGDETILKPQLNWKIATPKPLKTDAELAYITGGLSWSASYNLVSTEKGDEIDLVGWITMENQSGRDFADAKISLMAGDVNKIAPQNDMKVRIMAFGGMDESMVNAKAVTEKAFDEYHLYSLEHSTTLRDRETKQVEFLRAGGIKSETIYLYDGAAIDWNQWRGMNANYLRSNEEFGSLSNTKVTVQREFKNSKENGLGIPLPKGRVRFYRGNGSQLEFTGESEIDHTPTDETVRVTTGNAFDLVGERKRMNFQCNNSEHWANESFEITLRNHKKEPVVIRVVEHLYRWINWSIADNSDPYVKTDAQQIEFRIQLKPDEERKVTYKVNYSW